MAPKESFSTRIVWFWDSIGIAPADRQKQSGDTGLAQSLPVRE
jgi:hypothetical protein